MHLLKGIFNTMESIISVRDPEGFRMPTTQTETTHHKTEDQEDVLLETAMETVAALEALDLGTGGAREDYPEFTTPT